MGTTQHFALFEHASGYALFRIKEFDEITRNFTAHPNAFIKPVAFVHFKSVEEAIENVNNVSEGTVSSLLKQFINSNVPKKSCILGVSDEALGKAILACGFGFECVWHGGIREVLRVIRHSFSKLIKSLITQPGNAFSLSLNNRTPLSKTSAEEQIPGRVAESRTRLVVGLARARSQLNLSQHLADTAVVRALTLIDELDADLAHSVARLRTCYAAHFPEVCRSSSVAGHSPLSDVQLIHLIAHCPARVDLLSEALNNELKQIDVLRPILDTVRRLAGDSIGTDLSAEDAGQLKSFAGKLLRTMEKRGRYAQILARRVETLVPNLNALLRSTLPDSDKSIEGTQRMNLGDTLSPTLVAARLITNAGSLARLANMPTSRVLSLGASKALFRKSGAVAANATGLFGQFTRGATSSGTVADTTTDSSTNTAPLNIHQLKCVSASRIQADTIRRKAARLLAAKSSLASRADCFRYHNPPDSDTPGLQWTEDQRLTAGTFGKELGQDVQQQLRVWAETNGIHADRSEEQIKAQRDRRKRYRKTKRKAWLLRKLSRSTTVAIVDRTTGSVAAKFETGFPEQINDKQALNHTATVASASSSSSESDHEFLSTRLKETEFMLVDDDSRYTDDHLAKRRKVDLSRSGKSEILSPGICGTMSAKAPARRSPHIKTKQPIGVIG